MVKNRKYRNALLVVGVLILVSIIYILVHGGRNNHKQEVSIGFIMSGSCSESGWNGRHYQGIREACDELEVELLVKENIDEFSGECEQAVRDLVDEGAQMIFLSSYGYSEEVKDVVAQYPEINFYANSPDYYTENMSTYFARMYQARYLAGIVAGMQTKTNEIGYVAAMPNNEVNRGINAFALGVRSVNTDARVVVTWTGSWDDAQTETMKTQQLIEEVGVDVVTYHQNQANVAVAADQAGIQSIGYHEAVTGLSSGYLTAVVCDWERIYHEIIKEFLRGNGNVEIKYWMGIEKQAVDLTQYSELVSQETRQMVENARNQMLAGQDVFSEMIYDTEGNLRCSTSEIIADIVLWEQMDWYVEGVEFYEE